MFKLIQRAIARIIQVMGGATSTQPAGHAPQVHTTQAGKAPTALAGTNLQSKPASKSAKRKPRVAQLTKAVASPKQKPKAAPAKSGATGKPSATRASKTRQHAK